MINCIPCKSVFPNKEKFERHDCLPKQNLFIQCEHCCKFFEDDKVMEKHEVFKEKGHSLYGLSDQVVESCHQEFAKRLTQSKYDAKFFQSMGNN